MGCVTSESFFEVGGEALRQGGVDVEELGRHVCSFFLRRVCGQVWANMQRGSQEHLENYSCSNTNGNLHDKHEEKGLEV